MNKRILAALFMIVVGVTPVFAASILPINPNDDHVTRWNWFVDAVYALHKKQIKGKDIKIETTSGGYARLADFYKAEKFIDKKTGRHLSTVMWETKNPALIHSIEVYVYGKKNRIIRDFGGSFLTHSRAAPQQTLINLHVYNQGLHAYRQFDATNVRTYEFCEGKFRGKKIEIRLDDMEILEYEDEPESPMTTPVYKACFKGLPVKSAGKYLTPQ